MAAELPLDILVRITPHVTGTPDPDVAFGGVSIPEWAYEARSRATPEKLGRFTPTKPLDEYTADERKAELLRVAEQVLEGTEARATGTVIESVNPRGGPPWKITTSGGSILLEVQVDGTYERVQRFDFGVAVSYYLEVEFA